jgi:hypothetical protein
MHWLHLEPTHQVAVEVFVSPPGRFRHRHVEKVHLLDVRGLADRVPVEGAEDTSQRRSASGLVILHLELATALRASYCTWG